MAFSSSMVDHYKKFGYKGIIMDRDNIKLAIDSKQLPTHAKGVNATEIPILWSDSMLFQKVQHYAHGDISIDNSCLFNNSPLKSINSSNNSDFSVKLLSFTM